ncbi:MAG: M20/M25/M40 family metallo-hydrolase [Alphaproteobacteria bacterium]
MRAFLALMLALIAGAWIAYSSQKLPDTVPANAAATDFSADRAFKDVERLAEAPRPVGTAANARVRDELLQRMAQMGLSPQVRPGIGARSFRQAPHLVASGYVENVVGVLPGRDRTAPALALMAHYDSVPASPGAADDIMGVATILETVRAIKAKGVPARDVVLLITDGEEAGLLGANHFFRRDPLARRLGLVINVEARGSSGRVQMFQTSPENGGLIELYQRTAVRPASSSLAVLVYENLPNDTDLTEALGVNIPGLNYAIIGSQFDYHSPTATPRNLDRGSLQDMGTQVLAAAAEAAFASRLPDKAPSVIYANLFGDIVLAYPIWFGWILIGSIVVLMALAVRWARHDGAFPVTDILRGAGGLLFATLSTLAVLQFARRLTGAEFGYLEQRVLLAQELRWEWAVALIVLGAVLLAVAAMNASRRWLAILPLLAGLGCSVLGGFDIVGAVSGGLAALIGLVSYSRPVSRKGAWAGALLVGLLLAVAIQVFAPGASFLLVWPLLVAVFAAAVTALGSRLSSLALAILAVLAAVGLGWVGGFAHFIFVGMDMAAVFALPAMLLAIMIWPLAQPEEGARLGLLPGAVLLISGLAVTLSVRSNDPWTPRYPDIAYVGYQMDQDTGRAWRFSPARDHGSWVQSVLGADGGTVARLDHWAWPQTMLAAPAPPVPEPPPLIALQRGPGEVLNLGAIAPSGARTLVLRIRSTVPGAIVAIGDVPVSIPLTPGKWSRVSWATAARPLDLKIKAAGSGRMDVRYAVTLPRWPAGVAPLPARPTDLMVWDNSDSTFLAGTRAFTW